MFQPLDGPAVQDSLSVTTEVEAKVGGSALTERKVVTIQPLDGKIYMSFESGQPGMILFKNAIYTFEATNQQPIYITAVSGTVEVIVAERA